MRKHALLVTTALSGSLALSSVVANATTVSFTQSYDQSTLLSSPIDGAFDISGFLNSQGGGGNTVTVNSASMYIYGYSSQVNSYSSSYAGSFITGYGGGCSYWSGCYYYPIYGGSIYNVTAGDNQVESFVADFGDQNLSANDSHPATTSYASTYYTETYTTTGNDFGSMSASTVLSPASLNDLLSDSILPYSLSTSGGFDSLSVALSLDYSLSPAIQATPIPSSVLLFGSAGLGGLALLRRRRWKKGLAAT